MARGFILQPTYRVEAGKPIVHLYGRLESGASFLVRDGRCRPRFWIRAADADRARRLGAAVRVEEPARETMEGAPVACVELAEPAHAPAVRDRLGAAGVECFEADVRFAYRYLIDRGVRGSVEIRGAARSAPDAWVGAIFDDPEIAPAEWAPALSVLSVDIETDPTASHVLSIALVGAGASDVLLLTHGGASCPPGATPCATERWLLDRFVHRVREIDPDVITGWNVVDFDLAVLLRRGRQLGVPMTIGRGPEPLRLRASSSPRAGREAVLPGRLVMDGIQLVRGAFVRLESYSLGGAAREILGKEKSITGADRAGAIMRAYRHDRPHFVAYNRRDAELVLEILERLRLVELAVERSRLTGMPPDRVDASIASFDFLYLSELTRQGIVAPSVRDVPGLEAQAGGHVLEPAPGLYENVLVFDFRSLYPSIIRTFQIDPLGHARARRGGRAIVAPNGAAFAREPGILPRLLDELFPRRAAARARGDEVASHAIKILMNSCYGVLGAPVCRFASPAIAGAITSFGREILLWAKARIEAGGHRVLYGDTDSLFVLTGSASSAAARRLGAEIASAVNADLARFVRERWDVESRLELSFEKLYLRLLLPEARRGTGGAGGGARKRYAGLVDGSGATPGATRVELTGLEAVRRDWTELARHVQRELYERLFRDRPLDVYLRRVVADVRAGAHDDQLVYRKALRRRLESYTATTPPHVAAARKMRERPGRVIAYVMTTSGPEPARERRSPLDREHYVQKQVRAVSEPILAVLGLDFDAVVGDERQLRLF
jgi:DNA polymerase-2